MPAGPVAGAVLSLPLDEPAAARAVARRLVRTGTLSTPVCVGLALLRRLGEPEDIPVLRALTHLDGLLGLALKALEPLDPRTAALRWLDLRVRETGPLRPFVDALLSGGTRDPRTPLARLPVDARTVGPSAARRIAEAVDLPGLLRRGSADPRLVARAVRLLVRMASPRDYAAEVRAYRGAVELVERVVRTAGTLPPGVDHAAALLSLAVDLHSGPTRLLPWRDGQVEQLLDALGALLRSPAWEGRSPGRGPGRPRRCGAARSGCATPGTGCSRTRLRAAGSASRCCRATRTTTTRWRPASLSTGSRWCPRCSGAGRATRRSTSLARGGCGRRRSPGRCSSPRPGARRAAAARCT
ncbi:hypothetical protein AB6O49_33125 [Streptomyces sp. SBR177]